MHASTDLRLFTMGNIIQHKYTNKKYLITSFKHNTPDVVTLNLVEVIQLPNGSFYFLDNLSYIKVTESTDTIKNIYKHHYFGHKSFLALLKAIRFGSSAINKRRVS